MRNFNRGNNRFGGGRDFNNRRSFGGGRDFDRRDSSDRFSMHKATCSNCGIECEVPFRPTGSKPVFCNKCFENNRNSEPRRFENRNPNEKYNNYSENRSEKGNGNTDQYKKQFESLNWKLDKILKILAPAVAPVEVAQVEKTAPEEVKAVVKEAVKPKKKKPVVKKEISL